MKITTKIILSVSIMCFLIILSGGYFLAPRGRYPNAERYEFYVNEQHFINALDSIQRKYPENVPDSIYARFHNVLPNDRISNYGSFTFRSKKHNVLYLLDYQTSIAGYLSTTLAFVGVRFNKNGFLYRLNENLNEDESEKYIQDFETSILPLLEKELGMKAEIKD